MSDARPFRLGVTGNIACGKSLVSSMLAGFGATVIDADHVAHDVMQPGSEVLAQIASHFGTEVLNEDGSLNRSALGEIVFSNQEGLTELERITHPPTVREILKRADASDASVIVIDAIKLYESGLATHCQENWVVYCDPDVQIARLMERNGFSEELARQRIDAQPPQEEKTARADVVVDNSRSIEETREQVASAWRRISVG